MPPAGLPLCVRSLPLAPLSRAPAWLPRAPALPQAEAAGVSTASPQSLAERVALAVARIAHRQSLDPSFASPFTAELQQRAGPDMAAALPRVGGKADDVTAVVAVVAAA